MRADRFAVVVLVLLIQAAAAPAYARSLASQFDQILRFEGSLETSPRFRRELERVIVTFQENAVRTADFIATATTPGFAYSYDPNTGTFTRTETSRGSVYVEPADTLGRGGINLSFAYLYADFTELDGVSLEDSLPARQRRGADELDIETRKFDFRSQVFSVSSTYGITDRWDINLLVPVFLTTLKLNGTSTLLIPGARPFVNTFVANDSKLGIGDLLLRTKYRFPDLLGLQVASELILRLPSGNVDNFQGLGEVTVTPFLIAQRALGPHLLRANLGVEMNANDASQSRLRWAAGVTFRLLRYVSFSVDFVGSSGFVDHHFTAGDVSGVIARTDVADAVASFEFSLWRQVVAQVGAIVPLTDDGLQADVLPAGWIGARF